MPLKVAVVPSSTAWSSPAETSCGATLATVSVALTLPGASPEIMAASVTQPLERQFGQIPGVTQMTSSSVLGNSAITVQFDLSRNIDGAAQDIQTAINAASGQLPKNLPSPPTYPPQAD